MTVPIKYMITKDKLERIIAMLDRWNATWYSGHEDFSEEIDMLEKAHDACTQGVALMPYEAVRGEVVWAEADVVFPDGVMTGAILKSPVYPDTLYAETKIGNFLVTEDNNRHKSYSVVRRNGLPVMYNTGVQLVGDDDNAN